MEVFRPLRTALCVYEGLRLGFWVGACVIMQPEGNTVFPWLAAITPGALFLLMALFWRLDIARYRIYCPLYLAGKGLSICTTMFWLFFSRNDMIRGLIFNGSLLIIILGMMFVIMLGDILSAWFVIKLARS
jgi:hypothetical protein